MCSPIIELRQYTLRAGQRDAFVEIFERLIEDVEMAGAEMVGQFRDLDDPDRFVWVRGYRDMETRRRALTTFFGGPVWKANREAVNALLSDASNVLLLHPAYAQSGFLVDAPTRRPPRGPRTLSQRGLVVATIYYFDAPVPPDFLAFFTSKLEPVLFESGAQVLASFATEESPNDRPQHPIRANEHVFVWFALFADEAAHRHCVELTSESPRWQRELMPELDRRTIGPPETLRLRPTLRSLVRG
jgi:quinol monooxygenase YgiN